MSILKKSLSPNRALVFKNKRFLALKEAVNNLKAVSNEIDLLIRTSEKISPILQQWVSLIESEIEFLKDLKNQPPEKIKQGFKDHYSQIISKHKNMYESINQTTEGIKARKESFRNILNQVKSSLDKSKDAAGKFIYEHKVLSRSMGAGGGLVLSTLGGPIGTVASVFSVVLFFSACVKMAQELAEKTE